MKYIQFMLLASLAFGSFSIKAEEKQNSMNADSTSKKEGRVQNTGLWVATVVCAIGTLDQTVAALTAGRCFVLKRDKLIDHIPGFGYFVESWPHKAIRHGLTALALADLTLYFGRKTKQAAQEIKAPSSKKELPVS